MVNSTTVFIFDYVFHYLGLNHEVSLVPHAENKIEDVHFFLMFDHLHHGLDGDQRTSATNTSTACKKTYHNVALV